jgi:predicted transcriptional regulator
VSEQQAEQNHGGSGSVAVEPAVQAPSEASATGVSESSTVQAPAIAPDHETLPKDEAPAVQASAPEVVKAEPVLDQAAVEKAKESLLSGRLLIMSPGVRAWQKEAEEAKAEPVVGAPVKQRRFAGMAAIIALATLAGAVSGALATIGVSHFVMTADAANTASSSQALAESVSRIDADIAAIKAGLDHAAKTAQGQLSKTNDRLDKIEKAQAEPTSKIAKMSEALDKLRAAQAAVPASAVGGTSVAGKDTRETKDTTREVKDTREKDTREATGSVTQATTNVASASPTASVPLPTPAPPKTELARLPKVEGWVLRDVNRGGALIEGRQGLYEVYAGDPVPGLGKVDAIRKQDGRWVVVTTKGLVMAR